MDNPIRNASAVYVSTNAQSIEEPVGSGHCNWEARASVGAVAWDSVVARKDENSRIIGEGDCLGSLIVEGKYSEALTWVWK